MAKQKQRQPGSALAKKKTKCGAPLPVVDLIGEDGWMVVKRQKVTILIPPLPVNETVNRSNADEDFPQIRPRKTIDTNWQCPSATSSLKHSLSERENSVSQAPEIAIPTTAVHPRPAFSFPKTSIPSHLKTSENPQVSRLRGWKPMGRCRESKLRKQASIFANGRQLLNQRMRALNIEKKLRRAGGLTSWLVSLGLGRFVKIFQQKNVNKFQLANLTMNKLRDMGAFAVGPRRKLVHAIDCLCQPYCFEHLR